VVSRNNVRIWLRWERSRGASCGAARAESVLSECSLYDAKADYVAVLRQKIVVNQIGETGMRFDSSMSPVTTKEGNEAC